MPKVYLSNPGVEETVTRPVVLSIVEELFDITGLPHDTTILFPGLAGRVAQPGSTIKGKDNAFGNTVLPYGEKVVLDVREDHDPDRLFSTAVMEAEHLPIFIDDRVEVMMRPVYSPQDVTINFTYQAKDRTQAKRWRDEVRVRVGQQQTSRLHTADYAWAFPREYEIILQEINRMMNAVAPYNPAEDYDTWFAARASQRISTVVNSAGQQPMKMVAEKQMRVVGYYDFDSFPELGEKDADAESYIINFAYKFRYDKPVGCVLFFPLVIHNQLIKYLPDRPPELVDHHLKSFSNSTFFFRQFEKGITNLGVSEGFAIPPFDEFKPTSTPVHTLRVFTALTNIDTQAQNPRVLMNLNDLGGSWNLHPRILRFFQTEYPFLVQHFLSAFNVVLYRGRNLLPFEKLTMDSALNVTATEDLDLRKYYHVRLSIIDDWTLLGKLAQQRLRTNADVVYLLMLAFGLEDYFPAIVGSNFTKQDILDKLATSSSLPADFGSNYLSQQQWNAATNALNQFRRRDSNALIRQFNTVTLLTIAAGRLEK